MQVLPIKEAMSRAERNRRPLKTKKGENSSQLVLESMDPYICTHGCKKHKSRSEGSCPHQHILLTDCPFRFVIQWNELMVKNGCYTHNHAVSSATFATYPTSRGLSDSIVTARVDGILAVGAKRSRIYDYLLEHDQSVIQVDADNLVRNYASSTYNTDDNKGTAREIVAFAASDFPACRFAGFQPAVANNTRTRNAEKTALSDTVRGCVLKQAQEEGVESVFVPLNFGNLHWCCVVVKVAAKRVFYYDPLNQASYMNASKEVAMSLKIAGLNDLDAIPMNNPIQFDSFSCGVFVCWMFIRQITCVPPQDMSDDSFPRR